MGSKKDGEVALLEAIKLAEIYKAGFKDAYCLLMGKTPWKKIQKKCGTAFNKRFLKP